METREVVEYLEDPHNEPYVLRDLLHSEEGKMTVGDAVIEFEEGGFGELKSRLYDLEDLGVIVLGSGSQERRKNITVETEYELTGEARRFFFARRGNLAWAYSAAHNKDQEKVQK